MKIYESRSVLEAGLERIRWVFSEFPQTVCCVSGGKDSTVLLALVLQIAEELGRLPQPVMWLDQEAEFGATVEIVDSWMRDPRVQPYWLQVPFRLFNSTSFSDHWLQAWDPAMREYWVHPQSDISLTENIYGTDRFHELFGAFLRVHFGDAPAAILGGVMAEESPTRFMSLTYTAKYKGETWAKIHDARRGHYTFYPLYDWSYTDVWKTINDRGLSYNRIYDLQHRSGLPTKYMRVSSLHHETAIYNLFYLQEAEPAVYERLTQRLAGVDAAVKLGATDYFVSRLPSMFDSWKEYRDYLMEHLITDEDWRRRFLLWSNRFDAGLTAGDGREAGYRAEVESIIINDWEGVRLGNFWNTPSVGRKWKTHVSA